MSGAEGGDALPDAPSLWSGVRWRRRRAWRQPRSTSGSCERSRAQTRPASGPPSGTPGTGANDGRARAGQEPGSFRAVRPAASRRASASAGPSLRGSQRATSTLGEAGLPPQPGRGSPPRPPAPTAQLLWRLLLPSSRLGQSWVSLLGRLARSWATRARPADGGS